MSNHKKQNPLGSYPFSKEHIEIMIKWSEDENFCANNLADSERLTLDFHITSSRVISQYSNTTKKFLNTIRDKWILYKQIER